MRIRSARSFISTVIAALLWRLLGYSQQLLDRQHLPRLLCLPSDFLGKHIICNGVFEREVMEYVAGIVGSRAPQITGQLVFIDIGANVGNHTCYFAPRFDLTIAVEPSLVTASILRANVLLNSLQDKVAVIQAALSDHVGTATHYTSTGDNLGGSSLDNQRRDTASSIGEPVELLTGDAAVASVTSPHAAVAFIKIDVEGHELPVLQGLTQTLRRHRPVILFEADNGQSATSCLQLLRDLGYSNFMEISGDADVTSNKFVRLYRRLRSGSKYIEIRTLETIDSDRYYEAILCVPDLRRE